MENKPKCAENYAVDEEDYPCWGPMSIIFWNCSRELKVRRPICLSASFCLQVHPDKNPEDKERAQIAFDAVKRAWYESSVAGFSGRHVDMLQFRLAIGTLPSLVLWYSVAVQCYDTVLQYTVMIQCFSKVLWYSVSERCYDQSFRWGVFSTEFGKNLAKPIVKSH